MRDKGGGDHLPGEEWVQRNRDVDDALMNPGLALRVGASSPGIPIMEKNDCKRTWFGEGTT